MFSFFIKYYGYIKSFYILQTVRKASYILSFRT